jgi:DNA-binding XRE family transcriptional regulator
MSQGSDASRASRRRQGDFKGGGLRLSGLKQWRERRVLSQGELAKLVGVQRGYLQKVEQGRRGCNPWVAQRIAEELGVDLEALRAGPAEEAGAEGGVRGGRAPGRGTESLRAPGLPRGAPREGGGVVVLGAG